MFEVRKLFEIGVVLLVVEKRIEVDFERIYVVLKEMGNIEMDGELGEKVDFVFYFVLVDVF